VQQVLDDGGDLWVIGGGEVYAAFLASAHEAVVTEVDAELPGDTWAPALDGDWTAAEQVAGGNWLTSSSGLRYRVTWWRRRAVDGGAGSSEVGAALAGWHAGTGGAQQSGAGAGR
jgi:dihydrofolate reductase